MKLKPGLGQRFINEIDRCQRVLLDTPLIGQPYGRRLRKFTVGDKFPYSIVYAPLAEVLICISVRSWLASPGLLAYAVRPLIWFERSVRASAFGGPNSPAKHR